MSLITLHQLTSQTKDIDMSPGCPNHKRVLIQTGGSDRLRLVGGSKLSFESLVLENIFRLHCYDGQSDLDLVLFVGELNYENILQYGSSHSD